MKSHVFDVRKIGWCKKILIMLTGLLVIKDLLSGFRGNFSCRIQQVVPRGQDGSILPAWVANHVVRFVHLARSQR